MSNDEDLIKKLVGAAVEGYVEGKLERLAKLKKLEHLENSDCWCAPRLDYQDPETGVCVWVHHEREDSN